ncbi:MAG TPA: hypothetical protein VN133_13665 [Humibacter sp.]|nr:hypothetical protein [Humibacter sp.]
MSASRSHVPSVPRWQTITYPPLRIMCSIRDHFHARPTLKVHDFSNQTTYVIARLRIRSDVMA